MVVSGFVISIHTELENIEKLVDALNLEVVNLKYSEEEKTLLRQKKNLSIKIRLLNGERIGKIVLTVSE